MIAADTSAWISFFEGDEGADVVALKKALEARQVVMPPPVLTELLSDPELSPSVAQTLLELPTVPLKDGFWYRAGKLRSRALARKRKARLGDAWMRNAASMPIFPSLRAMGTSKHFPRC